MSVKRLILFLLITAALLTAHGTFGSPTAFEAEVGTSVSELTHLAQARAAIGRAGAVVAGPIVRSMTLDTRRLVSDLEPSIRTAPRRESRRARQLSNLVAQLDSAAHSNIEHGRPIKALKLAGEGRSLVADIRQVLAEERAFR